MSCPALLLQDLHKIPEQQEEMIPPDLRSCPRRLPYECKIYPDGQLGSLCTPSTFSDLMQLQSKSLNVHVSAIPMKLRLSPTCMVACKQQGLGVKLLYH